MNECMHQLVTDWVNNFLFYFTSPCLFSCCDEQEKNQVSESVTLSWTFFGFLMFSVQPKIL